MPIKIAIGVPFYGQQDAKWCNPLVAEAAKLAQDGIQLVAPITIGGMATDVARNEIVEKFLALDAEWLFWLDADNIIKTGTIRRLLDTRKSLVTGVYVKRSEENPEPLMYFARPDGSYEHIGAWRIDPNHYHALGHFSTHELARGRLDSALDAARKSEERNPLAGTTYSRWVLIAMKRYDEAIRLARKELADQPGRKDRLGIFGAALVLAGRREEGLSVLEETAAAPARFAMVANDAGVGVWARRTGGQGARGVAAPHRYGQTGRRYSVHAGLGLCRPR